MIALGAHKTRVDLDHNIIACVCVYHVLYPLRSAFDFYPLLLINEAKCLFYQMNRII